MLHTRPRLCALALLLLATNVLAAPRPKPPTLKTGDECIAARPFPLGSKGKTKGPKQKVAVGARVHVVAIDKGAVEIAVDGMQGVAPLRLLMKVCKASDDIGKAGASGNGAEPDTKDGTEAEGSEATPARIAPATPPTSAASGSAAASAPAASSPPVAPTPAEHAAGATTTSSSGIDTEAAEAVAAHAAIADSLGGEGMPSGEAHATQATGRAKARRIAVYDLKLEGIDNSMGAVVTESLLGELRKLQGISAIGMDEVRDMLAFEHAKDKMGCDDVTCLAEIGGALGVDDLLTGRLSRAGTEHVMSLRRIDQGQAQTLGTFNQRLEAGNGEEFLAAVGPAVEQLFPGQPLRPGVTRGVADEVALRLHPPPLPKWSFWTVTSGAVAAGVTAGVFAVLTKNAETRYQAQVQIATTQVSNGRTVADLGREATRDASYTNYSLIGAGALALTAGVMAFFTDFHGYASAAPPR